jgi:hypothetical protein
MLKGKFTIEKPIIFIYQSETVSALYPAATSDNKANNNKKGDPGHLL